MSWTLDEIAFIARWKIWPLLHPLESRLSELHRLLMELGKPGGQQVPVVQSSSSTQEFNFSTTEADDNFFAREDIAAELVDAQILYRAVGGERITQVIISAVAPGVDGVDVEIQRTNYLRGSAASFSIPIVVTLALGAAPVVLLTDQPLAAGDCLVAAALGAWSGVRVDGTIFIESRK